MLIMHFSTLLKMKKKERPYTDCLMYKTESPWIPGLKYLNEFTKLKGLKTIQNQNPSHLASPKPRKPHAKVVYQDLQLAQSALEELKQPQARLS